MAAVTGVAVDEELADDYALPGGCVRHRSLGFGVRMAW